MWDCNRTPSIILRALCVVIMVSVGLSGLLLVRYFDWTCGKYSDGCVNILPSDAGGEPGRDLLLSALRSHRQQTDRGHSGGQEPEEHGCGREFRSDG